MRIVHIACALLLTSAFAQQLTPEYPPLNGDLFLETRLLHEANFARAVAGLAPLELDDGLTLAARHHATEMAELGYFSHASPLPEHATLRHRLVLAGSPLVTVGENLALVQGHPDLAVAAVEGWLDSPGHRANLLGERFTHVGYGAAVDDSGATVIVQTLAYKPARLARSAVAARQLTVRTVLLTVWAEQPAQALFSLAGGHDLVLTLRRGIQQVEFTTTAELSGPVQLRAGVALGGGSFVLQDAGWLDSASGSWSPDPSSVRQSLSIEGVTVERTSRVGAAVSLRYQLAPGDELAVYLGDAQQRSAVSASGVDLLIDQPAFGLPLQVGVLSGSRVEIFHSFTVVQAGGTPTLRPAAP